MSQFTRYRTSLLQFGIAFLSIALLFSCEVEDYETTTSSLDFELPQNINLGESINFTAEFQGAFDSFEWLISDGSAYQGVNSEHLFRKSGLFTVTLNGYTNNLLLSTQEHTIQVLCESKTLNLSGSVNKALYTEGRIVLNTTKENGESLFLFLNEELVVEKEAGSLQELSLELETAINMGDSVLAFNQFNSQGYSYLQFKSTTDLNKMPYHSDFIDYNNGLLYLQRNSDNQLEIDYFNESSEKLWTKSFSAQSSNGSEHVFSLNNQLFYLSFNTDFNELYIEKFKNPSVVFQQKTINFETLASGEILFVSSNPIFNTINFGIYNATTLVTSIYKVDENCTIQLIKEIEGKKQIDTQFTTSAGEIITVSTNTITKYNSSWDVLAETEKATSGIGICPIGENLILLYENLPSGTIRLSYLDKHLQPVFFE